MQAKVSESFDVDRPLTLDARIAAGTLTIDATEATRVEVDVEPLDDAAAALLDEVRVVLRGATLAVVVPDRHVFFGDAPAFAVLIRCRAGSSAHVRSASADVTPTGALAEVDATTASGDVRLEAAGDVKIRTASGDVEVGALERRLDVKTASGSVNAQDVHGGTKVQTASGGIRLDGVRGAVTARTVSGDVEVAVEPGLDVWLDLASVTGETTTELPAVDGPSAGAAPIEIRARTVSGEIRVTRAVPVGDAA